MELVTDRVRRDATALERPRWHRAGRLAVLAVALLGMLAPPAMAIFVLTGVVR